MQRRFYDSIPKIPQDYILRYDFNGDYLDKSKNNLNGIKSGTAVFDVGRKGLTNECLNFTSGCVKTPSVLPVNNSKVSMSFWLKTNQSTTAIIMEMSPNTSLNNAFSTFLNDRKPNTLQSNDFQSPLRNIKTIGGVFGDVWRHIVITIDRSGNQFNTQNIYINNILTAADLDPTLRDDTTTNFANNILYVGQRNATSFDFKGSLQDVRLYNRILSISEINRLYNE